jgi:hypothetical protein
MTKIKFSRTAAIVLTFLAGIWLALAWPAALPVRGESSSKSLLAPVGSGFTYQGRLVDNNSPANGSYDIQFLLFDAEAVGVQIGATVTHSDVPVSQGFSASSLILV